jgi:hypothetical protein
MAMTLSEMRTFVRAHADADAVDAPDTTLDVYARIAYNDILSRSSWPHLTVSYTFTTVAGQSEYPFSAFSATDLEEVTAVVDTTNLGRRLVYVSKSDADLAFGQPINAQSEVANAYTVSNGNLILYPIPSTTGKQYTVRGKREPAAWPAGAASIPDLPDVLHEPIAWFMLSSFFMAQEDPMLAGVYQNEYELLVRRHTRDQTTKEYKSRPLVMGGQNYPQPDFTRWVRGQLEG